MTKRFSRSLGLALLIGVLGLLLLARPTPAAPLAQDGGKQSPSTQQVKADVCPTGPVLARFKTSTASDKLSSDLAGLGVTVRETLPGGRITVLNVAQDRAANTVDALRKLPEVETADLNYISKIAAIPNDPYYAPYQWNMPRIHAPEAWDTPQGAGPVIGVIDTGLDLGHPEFAGRVAAGMGRVFGQVTTADDNNGHGTHVAGVIAAKGNDGVGVAGVAWNATLKPFKSLNAQGSGCNSDWLYGLNWLAGQGVKVINMSLTSGLASATEQAEITDLWNSGVLIIAAAGNDADSNYDYPASYDHVISVASIAFNNVHSSFSNFNDQVDITAPGGGNGAASDPASNIISTWWRADPITAHFFPSPGYAGLAGTSMAAPHVTGAAALLLTAFPNLTNIQLQDALFSTATDMGAPGRDNLYGNGLLDVKAALDKLTVPPTPTSGPGCIFSDVCPSNYWFTPVQYLVNRGAVSGYSNNTFRPFNNTTRAQLTKILVVGEGWTTNTTGGPHFTDVTENNVFYDYVETAYNHTVNGQHIINGYADSSFKPFNDITRGQLAKIVVLAQGWTTDTTDGPHFIDVSPINTFYNFVETAYHKNIISGYDLPNGQKEFRVGASATRGQISKIVYLSLNATQ